jgi:hypothetical protein
MEYIMELFRENTALFLLLGFADVLFSFLLVRMLYLPGSKRVAEALGTRNPGLSLYRRCSGLVAQGMTACEKQIGKGGVYKKARVKMRKAGYKGDYSALLYLAVKYVLSPVVFAAALALNYPDLLRPLASVVLINSVMEMVISAGKRKINLRFQKYIYKIYKYLHNQISSGMKPTDAVRSVYEIIDDSELRGILVRLAARYELTLDIDAALEEFRSNFDVHEAETLCLALKQGIDTGDNKDLLSRQEDVMFKKYFNYIQAETDSCRNRSVAAAAVFVAIVAVMIIVPMLNEVSLAVGKIFIN